VENEKTSVIKDETEENPPKWLFFGILKRIDLEKQIRRIKKVLTILFFGVSGVSVTAAVILVIAGGSVVRSEFGRLLSLLFTDTKLMLLNWSNYALALLESMPGLTVIVSLFAIVLILGLAVLFLNVIEKWLSLRKKIRDSNYGGKN